MGSMSFNSCKLLILTLLSHSLAASAQDLSPRAYWPSPVGTRVATVGYSHSSGDVIPDRSLPITGVDSSIDAIHLGYRHTLNLWNRTANLTVEAPYVDGTTVGTRDGELNLERQYSGMGDLAATISVNILGAPAMTRQEFGQKRGDFRHILGASLKVVAPTGKYDSSRLISVGANRWAVKAELGYIAVLGPQWVLETSLGTWFFEDNDDFLGLTKEQDPVVTIQGHLIHRFRPGLWASLDVNYYEGGRSTIGGRRLDDLQRDSKIGGTLVFPFATGHVIKLGYTKGSINDSGEDFDVFVVSYQQVF
ncbi:MAG: transporter [Proteobacteria bacterium]|nr:transporter [Pseudomonadota bacterium]